MSYPAFTVKPFPVRVVRAESLIPQGTYCYTPVPDQASDRGFHVKKCPFWKQVAGQARDMNGWCDYLKAGDSDSEGASMLFDMVKECGVKAEDPEDLLL